jgi:hypothetical protein
VGRFDFKTKIDAFFWFNRARWFDDLVMRMHAARVVMLFVFFFQLFGGRMSGEAWLWTAIGIGGRIQIVLSPKVEHNGVVSITARESFPPILNRKDQIITYTTAQHLCHDGPPPPHGLT